MVEEQCLLPDVTIATDTENVRMATTSLVTVGTAGYYSNTLLL